MEELTRCTRYPVVITCSTTRKQGAANLLRLGALPQRSTHNLTLNPIPQTSLTKALRTIVAKQQAVVPDETIDDIALSCNGDLRNAVMALQMAAVGCPRRKGRARQPARRKTKRGAATAAKTDAAPRNTCARDPIPVLFHSLGKVLYNKRETTAENLVPDDDADLPSPMQLPSSLANMRRWPCKSSVEDLLHRSTVEPGMFAAFLHQNYLPFFTEIDDTNIAAKYLSDACTFQDFWQDRDTFSPYCSSIAARGLMFSNLHPAPRTWKAFHRPQGIEANRNQTQLHDEFQVLRRSVAAAGVTSAGSAVSSQAATELMPWLPLFIRHGRCVELSYAERRALQRYGTFSDPRWGHGYVGSRPLVEGDDGMDEEPVLNGVSREKVPERSDEPKPRTLEEDIDQFSD